MYLYLVINSEASRWISFGNVAENMRVCRAAPVGGMPSRSTTRRICMKSARGPMYNSPRCYANRDLARSRTCGSKPMSSMRSVISNQ